MLVGSRRKTAFALAENVLAFVAAVGIDNVAFFTATFDSAIMPREGQRRMNNFARRVMKEHFGERVRVSEFTRRGRIHFHFLVDCRGDVRTGFNWAHYKAVREWGRSPSRRLADKPQGSLGRSQHLRALHLALNAAAPKYHIGRLELVPVKSTAEAVGAYLGDYMQDKDGNRERERHKGMRWVNYSRGAPRTVGPARWGWGLPGRSWRRKLSRWAIKHSCASLDDVRSLFGPHWAYHSREAIAATDPDEPLPTPPPEPPPGEFAGTRRFRLRARIAHPFKHRGPSQQRLRLRGEALPAG